MDTIEQTITTIAQRVYDSGLSETEKADILAQLTVGMHRLVWPILLSHVPEYMLKETVSKESGQFTLEDYAELIESALKNPATAKEIHDELTDALVEVEELLTRQLPVAPKKKP